MSNSNDQNGTPVWEELGQFPSLNAASNRTAMRNLSYYCILERKDEYVERRDLADTPEWQKFESLTEALWKPANKDDKKNFTYYGTEKKKDKDTGVTKEVTGDHPKKKYVTVTADMLYALQYTQNRYINEAHQFFKDANYSFPHADTLIADFVEYTRLNIAVPITPTLVAIAETIDVNRLMQSGNHGFLDSMVKSVSDRFKNRNEDRSDVQVGIISEIFVKFVKIVASLMGQSLVEHRQAVNSSLYNATVRQLEFMIRCRGQPGIDETFYVQMNSFVDTNKPKKTEKEELEELDDTPVTPKKRSTPKKGGGRKKGGKNTNVAPDDSIGEITDLDESFSALTVDDDWDNSVTND